MREEASRAFAQRDETLEWNRKLERRLGESDRDLESTKRHATELESSLEAVQTERDAAAQRVAELEEQLRVARDSESALRRSSEEAADQEKALRGRLQVVTDRLMGKCCSVYTGSCCFVGSDLFFFFLFRGL